MTNYPVLCVATICALAFVAHVIGGTRDTAAIAPDPSDQPRSKHWVQAMCAFQMLSVDLLVMAGLLFAVAMWDLGEVEIVILQAAIGVFLLWALVWVIQVLWVKRPGAGLLNLPHWIVWLVCAALLSFGL